MLLKRRPIMVVPAYLSNLIWMLGGVGSVVAVGLMLRRQLCSEFPVFFSYLLFRILDEVGGVVIFHYLGRASLAYNYEYWIAQAVGLGLRFGVIYEIFLHVFRAYEGLRRASTLVFRWGGVLLLMAAIFVAILGPSSEPIWALKGSLVVQRSIDVVQCGLLLLLFLFASYFALTWRNYVFGVALGFGVMATLELLASAVAAQASPMLSGFLLNSVPRIGYDIALVIWAAYLISSEPARQDLTSLPQHDLEKWNQELLELLHR